MYVCIRRDGTDYVIRRVGQNEQNENTAVEVYFQIGVGERRDIGMDRGEWRTDRRERRQERNRGEIGEGEERDRDG